MNTLNATDMHFILSRTPRDVRELLQSAPLYLAGGFIRACIAGEEAADLDILGPEILQLENAALKLATERKGRTHKTENAITVIAPPRRPVQMITRWLYSDPETLISQFDFTIVQAVIWWQPDDNPANAGLGHGKWMSVCSDSFYPDLAARRLVYTCPVRHEDAGGSMLRVLKYQRRGYRIAPESLGKVIARLVQGIDLSRNPDLIFRGDDREVLSEYLAAPLITALLREVDPLLIIDGLETIEDHRFEREEKRE